MKTLTPQMSTKDFFNAVLPSYGTKLREEFKKMRWLAGHKFWLINDYLHSQSGNYYYEGVRFADNIVVFEKDGEWIKGGSYLDELKVFMFDGKQAHLIDSRQYQKTFRTEEIVRSEVEDILQCYLKAQSKQFGQEIDENEMKAICNECVDRSFKDFLDDDYEIRLMQVLPMLESHVK